MSKYNHVTVLDEYLISTGKCSLTNITAEITFFFLIYTVKQTVNDIWYFLSITLYEETP